MKQDEILKWAEEQRLKTGKNTVIFCQSFDGSWVEVTTDIISLVKDIAKTEREACLKIAESMSLDENMSESWRTGCRDVAEAIRARGQA